MIRKIKAATAAMRNYVRELHDDTGATAVEYGLIAALLSIAAIGGYSLVGTNLSIVFHDIATNI